MSEAKVPPARSPAPSHDDGLADAIALVEAACREDTLAVAVLGRHADDASVIAALVQLLGSQWSAADIETGEFRAWAQATAEGGTA
jgi:hypothetical protein